MQPAAPGTEQQRVPGFGDRQHRPPVPQPVVEGALRRQAVRDRPLPPTLAAYPDDPPILVDVGGVDSTHLADPYPGAVEQFEQYPVAQPYRLAGDGWVFG